MTVLKNINLVILFLLLFFSANAQIGGFVDAPSGRTRIGDHFTVKYSIDRDPELTILEIDYSVLDSAWIKIIDTTGIAETQKSGSIQMDFEITYSLYKEGEVNIPGIPVYYTFNSVRDTFVTEGVNVKVEFLPSPDSIAPLKDIIEEEEKWYDNILYYIIAGLILLVLIWFIVRSTKKSKQYQPIAYEPVQPEPHAHEVALEQLKLLEEKKLIEVGKFKDFQIELTGIMRTYIKKRFDINATEMTSKETIRELSQKVTSRQLVAVKEVLDIADLVKFAKYQPAETIHNNLLEKARNFFIKTAKNIPHL